MEPPRESTPLKRQNTGRSIDQTPPLRVSRSQSISESKLNLQFWGASFLTNDKLKPINMIDIEGEKIFEIYSGETHLFINTKSKNIYGYGDNKFKQIEQSSTKECLANMPIEITLKINVIKIFCGCDYSYCIGNKTRLYSWGLNFKGQLGLGHFENVSEPTQVKSFIMEKYDSNAIELPENEYVVDVQCGSIHAIVQTNKDRLFSTGFGETYALGHGNTITLNIFKEIAFFSELLNEKKLVVGKVEVGVSHSACIISKKLYIWGMFGKEKSQLFRKPAILHTNNDIIEFFLGDFLTVILTESGEVFAIGDNIDDQLTSDSTTLIKVPIPSKIEYIAGGLNHVFAVNFTRGKIFAWGSNRFGQINPSSQQQTFKSPSEMTWLYQNGSFALTCKGNTTFFVSKSQIKLQKDQLQESIKERPKDVSSIPSQTPSLEMKELICQLDMKAKTCENLSKENNQLKGEIARLTNMNSNSKKLSNTSTLDSNDGNTEINDCFVKSDFAV